MLLGKFALCHERLERGARTPKQGDGLAIRTATSTGHGEVLPHAHVRRAQPPDGHRRHDGLRDAGVPIRQPRQPNLRDAHAGQQEHGILAQ